MPNEEFLCKGWDYHCIWPKVEKNYWYFRFFNVDKKVELEIENYIERLKLMHSNVFRKSLNVPSKSKALN